MSDTQVFAINERCLCYHGPLIYEAKVLKKDEFDSSTTPNGITGTQYLVHYKGWKQTWDEYVPPDRLLKLTETNLELQKTLAHGPSGSTASKPHHKEASSGAGGTGIGSKSARKDASRGTKRGRDDEGSSQRPEMKLNVPEALKVQLVDDWENVTKNNMLVDVPRTPTVDRLLEEFEAYVKETKPPGLREPEILIHTIVSGLKVYFDRSCGANLLYRSERPQYAYQRQKFITGQQVKIPEQKEMSEIYGAEHLLRMLVTLPDMVKNSSMDPESVSLIRDYVNEMFLWLEKNKDRLFKDEYVSASIGYQNISRA